MYESTTYMIPFYLANNSVTFYLRHSIKPCAGQGNDCSHEGSFFHPSQFPCVIFPFLFLDCISLFISLVINCVTWTMLHSTGFTTQCNNIPTWSYAIPHAIQFHTTYVFPFPSLPFSHRFVHTRRKRQYNFQVTEFCVNL